MVAERIAELRPELICGTQMERHTARKHGLNCMVIAPPTHIENHLLSYKPFLGFDGADVIADEVYTTCTLGIEKHLIDLFGDAGLEHGAKNEALSIEKPEQAASTPNQKIAEEPAQSSTLNAQLEWSPEAQTMLGKVPFFVRGKVKTNVEKYAREQGHALISADVLSAAREALGA